MTTIPVDRVRSVNDAPVRNDRDIVLYWMIAARRTKWNFGLQRAIEVAAEFSKPLIVLEALRCDYQWSSDRFHRFVLQGMADNRASFKRGPIRYYAYVEPYAGAGNGLLPALAQRSCAVVTDEFPCFFLPQMVAAAGRKLDVRLEAVDSNGLLPMSAADKTFARAHDFRRWLQKNLQPHLEEFPKANPLQGRRLPKSPPIPRSVLDHWPEASPEQLRVGPGSLAELPIDHHVGPAVLEGGMGAANECLERFLNSGLCRYAAERNQPSADAASGLSPYLHFGHISAHEVFTRLARLENWSPASLKQTANGARLGWWGMSEPAESFFDELITWRELGYNQCWRTDDYDQYESLPAWSRQTLADHAADPRNRIYSLEQFEAARTHDPLWNAAQNQLVAEGRMHNYLRMLWGKKVLEWSPTPREALQTLIHLNNKYALDGRDPNSYSGIFWIFGRYDRAWGPERPIFGKVRYMSSENTARKLNVDQYLEAYGTST